MQQQAPSQAEYASFLVVLFHLQMCTNIVASRKYVCAHSLRLAASAWQPTNMLCTAAAMQVLCMHLMLACITVYNALADLLPLLPSTTAPGTPAAARHVAALCQLPSMLRYACVAQGRCDNLEPFLSMLEADEHESGIRGWLISCWFKVARHC